MQLTSWKARSHAFWDKIGMTVSSICFAHCVSTPLLILLLPWLGEYFHSHIFHIVIFFLVLPIGLYAFIQGYRHHKNQWVLLLGVPGLLIISLGAFLPELVFHEGHNHTFAYQYEILTVLGSLLLIGAHYLNRRTCRIQHKHHHQ